MLERERRIKEERDEEERLAKERDQLAWQHEQESRKQMEREVILNFKKCLQYLLESRFVFG